MIRRLLNFLTAVSLLLCVAACVLWAHSHSTALRVSRYHGTLTRSVTSDSGRIAFTTDWSDREQSRAPVWRLWTAPAANWGGAHLSPWVGRYGFGSLDQMYAYTGGTARQRQQWVPHWFVVAVTALLPSLRAAAELAAAVGRRMTQRRLARVGLCRSCGYDLTGNVSGLCPECGTPAAPRGAAAGGRA